MIYIGYVNNDIHGYISTIIILFELNQRDIFHINLYISLLSLFLSTIILFNIIRNTKINLV